MSQRIAIIGPMVEEIEHFKHQSTITKTYNWGEFEFNEGELHGKQILLVRSGVGKVNTAMVCQRIIDCYQPYCIIMTGVAGALNASYEIGDVVIGLDYVQHDLYAGELGFARGQVPYSQMHYFPADAGLLELLANYEPKDGKIHKGRILSGDQFLTQRELHDYGYLTGELKGDAVEMESGAGAQVCLINQTKFITIRVISDKADGAAAIDFPTFLPLVADKSYDLISNLLKAIQV